MGPKMFHIISVFHIVEHLIIDTSVPYEAIPHCLPLTRLGGVAPKRKTRGYLRKTNVEHKYETRKTDMV